MGKKHRHGSRSVDPSFTSPIEVLEPRRLLDGIAPAGPEFPVNTHTAGSQQSPSIAVADDGDFVIVWCGAGEGDDSGIFAQRVDAAGQKRGAEFLVNTHTAGTQLAPVVAIDAADNILIAWCGVGPDDPDGVYARRFDAAGTALGDAFRVNSYTAGKQQAPTLTFAANVGFVIAWESYAQDGSNYGIYAQRYDLLARTLGGEFRVSQITKGHQRNPALAADAQGNFVLAWMGQSSVGRAYDVYARRYAANGQPQAAEFIVNSTTADAQQNPSLSVNASGAFVVAWESQGQDDPDEKSGIYAQAYDPWGQKTIGEILVNTCTVDEQRMPAIALSDDGTFAVAWNSLGQDGSLEGVYTQYFDGTGQRVAGEFRVNNPVEKSQANPAIAMDAHSNFVIVWQSDGQDGGGNGIYARRYLRSTQRSSIGDFVWNDTDGDGVQDATERGVDGVIVKLLDQANRLLASTTTTGGGWYGFRDLQPGTYCLEFILPSGFLFAPAHRDSDDTLDSDVDTSTGRTPQFVVGSNQAELQHDAGLLAWPSIAGVVFNDRDGDGKRESGEAGLAGWIVYLDANRNARFDAGETFTTTNPTGQYALTGLSPGAYRLALSPQALWKQTSPANLFYDMTLAMGQAAIGVDFGNQTAIPNSSARAGSLLTVNTTPCGEVHSPAVAMNAAGDFALAWSGYSNGDGWWSFAQRYGSTVRKRGSELVIMPASWNDLAMDATGNFAIVGFANASLVMYQYTAEGILQGGAITITERASDDPHPPVIAMDADGDRAVAWAGAGPDGTGNGVHLQLYNAAGAPQGDELYLPSATHPALAMDAAGNFVLAWEVQVVDQAGSLHHDLRARRYSAAGESRGPTIRVNTTLTGEQCDPTVAMDSTGNFVIAWDSNTPPGTGFDATGWGIYAQRYTAAGEPQGGEFLVNTHTAGNQRYPAAAMAEGEFVVAWTGSGADGDGVYAQRYNAAGVPQGDELSVGSAGTQFAPDLAIDPAGNFIITWPAESGVVARRYSVNHAPTTRGIANVIVSPNASDTVIDLYAVFADDKDSDAELTYSIANNSSPSLFSATRIDSATGRLILTYAPGAAGAADITVRATDTGNLWAQTTFTVTIGRALQGTSADDRFYLRLDSSRTMLHLWQNTPITSEPSSVLPFDTLRDLSLDGAGGNDAIILDWNNGSPIPPGGLIINAGTLSLETKGVPPRDGFALHLRNSAVVKLASSLKLSNLTLAPTASLDLSDNDLILSANEQTRQQVLQQANTWIKSARGSDGKWLGPGLTSSAAGFNKHAGLAAIINADKDGKIIKSTFANQPATTNDVLVKYTWNGDVNLDGKIDIADYFWVDQGFIKQAGGYRNGDLNLDGKVDLADYFLIDAAFIAQNAVLGAFWGADLRR